jgi:hypothetical protein
MADFDSSLPIRTESAGDAEVKIVDQTTPSQGLAVDTEGKIKTLLFGNNGTADVVLPVDATSGALKVDIVSADGITVDVDLNHENDDVLVYGFDGAANQKIAVDSNGNLQVEIVGNSPTNPVFVQEVVVASVTTPIHEYQTAVDVAKDNTMVLEYTVSAGKTLTVTNWGGSGSDKIRASLSVETGVATGVFNDQDVLFNSTSAPNPERNYASGIQVAAGVKVRVTVLNRSSTQDVYAFLNGQET